MYIVVKCLWNKFVPALTLFILSLENAACHFIEKRKLLCPEYKMSENLKLQIYFCPLQSADTAILTHFSPYNEKTSPYQRL